MSAGRSQQPPDQTDPFLGVSDGAPAGQELRPSPALDDDGMVVPNTTPAKRAAAKQSLILQRQPPFMPDRINDHEPVPLQPPSQVSATALLSRDANFENEFEQWKKVRSRPKETIRTRLAAAYDKLSALLASTRGTPVSPPSGVSSASYSRIGHLHSKNAPFFILVLASITLLAVSCIIVAFVTHRDTRPNLTSPNFSSANGLAPIDPKEFAKALHMSMWFYHAQRSGPIHKDPNKPRNPVTWRGDAQMHDGENGKLAGGFYDAGDFVKFHLPFGFSATFLAWGALEFGDGYDRLGLLDTLFDHIDHAADYIFACWDGEKQQLAAQVGNPQEEHPHWVSPEVLEYMREDFPTVPPRTVYYLNQWRPGTEISSEFAAALCAGALAKRRWNRISAEEFDRRIRLAQTLFAFGERHPQTYTLNVPDGEVFYPSSGYNDELAWGALWLYKATNITEYHEKTIALLPSITPKKPEWTLSWDDKKDGVYALLLDDGLQTSTLSTAHGWATDSMKFWLDEVPKNSDGLRVLSGWGSLRLAANQAFLAELYAKRMDEKRKAYREFADIQARFMLGQNTQGFSFVCGLSPNSRPFPLSPHHRAAHGTWKNDSLSKDINRHVLYGALVGGPSSADSHDSYSHDRGDFQTNEVSIDYNAGFSGLLAALVERNNVVLPGFLVPSEQTGEEFRVEAHQHREWFHKAVDLRIAVVQTTGWPPRRIPLKYRYFMVIEDKTKDSSLSTEFLADSIKVERAENMKMEGEPTISAVQLWSRRESTYFFDVSWNSTSSPYPAPEHYRYETNIRISLHHSVEKHEGVRFYRKDDFSFPPGKGPTTKIPLYSNGEVVYGEEAPK